MSKDTNQKICIVGAGPAGLAAAMYLEKKGYNNYAILEKEDHVGGKCFSPTYNGKRYEMGAIMGVKYYYTIKEMMDFSGVTPDGPKMNRGFIKANGKKEFLPFSALETPKVIRQVRKYMKLLETKYKGYDKNNHLNTHPDLMMSFHDFCVMNGVEMVENLLINPYTSFGYGFFDNVPAAYVVQYLDIPTTIDFFRFKLWTWKDGTQSIYEHVNDTLKNKARLNTDITKITRENNKVQVYTAAGTEEFDKIILTAPLDHMIDLMDATKDEVKYFSQIQHSDYQVFAFTVKNYPSASTFVMENMVPSRMGHAMVFYRRWDENDQIITAYVLGNHPCKKTVSLDESRKLVFEDMKKFGYEVDKLVYERNWYYFPHVSPSLYQSGWYDAVESWQGQLNTYYAGEVMSFGDMDETCQYSKSVVERFF